MAEVNEVLVSTPRRRIAFFKKDQAHEIVHLDAKVVPADLTRNRPTALNIPASDYVFIQPKEGEVVRGMRLDDRKATSKSGVEYGIVFLTDDELTAYNGALK